MSEPTVEKKENLCEICEDTGYVHVTSGWKDFSFGCPKCNSVVFQKGIENIKMSRENAINLIESFGQPGDG